ISGNANHGTFGAGNSAPTWTQGKLGKALSFNSNDYINSGTAPSLNITGAITVETWVYPNEGTGQQGIIGNTVFSQPFGMYLRHAPGQDIGFWVNPDGNRKYVMIGTIVYNQWSHITGTWDGTTLKVYLNGSLISSGQTSSAYSRVFSNTYIGNVPGIASPVYFDGKIDQVRIYNYARTPAQIAWDYNRGKPIAHYKMDECQGATIADWSFNNHPGTLSIGASGTQNSIGTCSVGTSAAWTNGVTGKINSSLNFDGTDDYLSVGNIGTSATALSFWLKPASTTQSIAEISASDNVTISSGTVSVTGFGTETIYVDGRVSSTIPNTAWHHVTVVSSASIPANTVNIGKVSSTYYSGLIDDVKIFNYALTSDQVKTLYNGGAVSFN
ncbi:LamG domain-containing protein, partial [Patescibacteria group bacterium]|nr:LamG domain-containing protein [Patescibacteria group bacterium]